MGSLPQVEGIWLNPLMPSHPIVDKTSLQGRSSNRSPVESPPAQKKALFRVSSSKQEVHPILGRFVIGESDHSAATLDRTLRASATEGKNTSRPTNPEEQYSTRLAGGKENRSILKGCSSKDKLSKEMTRSGSVRVKRKVEFEPSVKVFHFDKVAGEHVGSESQTLSTEARDRREFIQRMTQNKLRVIEEPSSVTSDVIVVSNMGRSLDLIDSDVDVKHSLGSDISEPLILESNSTSQTGGQSSYRLMPRPLPILRPSQPAGEDNVASTVEFNFFEDEEQRLRIKFTVPLGEGVAATDVLVKANLAGNKIRVVATRTINGKSLVSTRMSDLTSRKEEFSERYILPMEVDPYLITARLDGIGNLYVEAPIMTAERKKAVGTEKQNKTTTVRQGFSL